MGARLLQDQLVLLRDGADVLVVVAASARFEPRARGAYRVEASYKGRPWIWSSALRVE